MFLDFAIPPPALSGSGSRVESEWLSSQPGSSRLPVRYFCYGEYKRLLQNVKNGINLGTLLFDAISPYMYNFYTYPGKMRQEAALWR